MHGAVTMFLFAIPVFEAIAMTLMPQMLGARDLPFLRRAAFGFWCFVLGGIFPCGAIFFDARSIRDRRAKKLNGSIRTLVAEIFLRSS